MPVKKKKIDLQKIDAALGDFEENLPPDPEISLQEFITTRLGRLEKVGKKLKALHDFLTSRGFDVGTYHSFKRTFQRVKHIRKEKEKEATHEPSAATPVPKAQAAAPPQTALAPLPKESATAAVERKNADQAEEATKKPELYGNRPIKGADGVNYYIDPATGGRKFDI
jgi:hypothetical protein